MKKLLPITLLLLTFTVSCKKAIEDKQRDLLIDAMTNGQWLVQQYLEGTVDVSAEFSGFEFQFEENGAVHAVKSGSVQHGTWVGDINNYSITSNFPAADEPVKKLNGVWRLTDSDWNYVKAEMTTANGKNLLHLVKKP